MIDRATVDRIYASANIVEVISDFISLTKKGTNYQACCPFHGEKTPSFVVSPSKGIYKCFGCGKGGNAISFVMEHESMTYVEALKFIARKYGIEVVEKEENEEQLAARNDRENMMLVTAYADEYFQDKLLKSTEGLNVGLSYFRERGFNDITVNTFSLGYCPSSGDLFSRGALEAGYKEQYLVSTGLTIKRESGGYYDRFAGRVIFPIHSISGRVIGFGGRILTSDKKKAKYLNSPESEIYHKTYSLYGIYQAKRAISNLNKCILVEGYTDVISMHQNGIENVVASSGTSLTAEQVVLIRRFTNNVTIIYDGDSAGIKASLRGINLILKEGLNVRIVPLPEGEDPDSFARSHSAADTYQYIQDNEEDFISFKTKLLLKDVNNDPIAKTQVIHDIVESIAVIGDEVLRAQYIKECSRLMDADDAVLSREVMRKVVSSKGGKQALEVHRNTIKKQNYLARQESQSSQAMGEDYPPYMGEFMPDDAYGAYGAYGAVVEGVRKRESTALYEMEKELVSYLVKNGEEDIKFIQPRQEPIELNIAELIIEEMESDELSFVTPVFNTIYTEYVSRRSAKQSVSVDVFINYPDPSVTDFIVDILTFDDTYKQSKIWSKHTGVVPEGAKLSEAIPKCIALYKLKRIEMLIADKKHALRDENANYVSILKELNILNDSRRGVCAKYERIL